MRGWHPPLKWPYAHHYPTKWMFIFTYGVLLASQERSRILWLCCLLYQYVIQSTFQKPLFLRKLSVFPKHYAQASSMGNWHKWIQQNKLPNESGGKSFSQTCGINQDVKFASRPVFCSFKSSATHSRYTSKYPTPAVLFLKIRLEMIYSVYFLRPSKTVWP